MCFDIGLQDVHDAMNGEIVAETLTLRTWSKNGILYLRTVYFYYGNITNNKLFALFKAIKENTKYMDINEATDFILHSQNRRI